MSNTHCEEIMIERAGLESRRGQKIFSYTMQKYRLYCGECCAELKNKDSVCVCGWTTTQYTEVGL